MSEKTKVTFEFNGKTYQTDTLPTWMGQHIILRDTGEVIKAQTDLESMPPQPGKIVAVPNKNLTPDLLINSEIEAIITVQAQALNAVIATLVQ